MSTLIENNEKPAPSPEELDELIALGVLGDLKPAEIARLDELRKKNPEVEKQYQETQMTHQLIGKDARAVQPDDDFERRILDGVKERLKAPPLTKITTFGLLAALLRRITPRVSLLQAALAMVFVTVIGVSVLVQMGRNVTSVFSAINDQLQTAQAGGNMYAPTQLGPDRAADFSGGGGAEQFKDAEAQRRDQQAFAYHNVQLANEEQKRTYSYPVASLPQVPARPVAPAASTSKTLLADDVARESIQMERQKEVTDSLRSTPQGGVTRGSVFAQSAPSAAVGGAASSDLASNAPAPADAPAQPSTPGAPPDANGVPVPNPAPIMDHSTAATAPVPNPAPVLENRTTASLTESPAPPTETKAEDVGRKLIRDASLELEVTDFTKTSDNITKLARANGGYVDTTNSERGGNGKLRGVIVVKVLPPKIDDFLFALRTLGEVQNQSITTQDVTKDYFDIQARMVNAQKTEEQLQLLLEKNNGKVSELLTVEREISRVRGDIESMQGQLKLFDFQVAYATVTLQVSEKDLNETAKYLLKETDSLSLKTDDVDSSYQGAHDAVLAVKGQILHAEQNKTGQQNFARITASIPPDEIEHFLESLKSLGRVEDLQRQKERVAQDGGDSAQPADDSRTDKDKVIVGIDIKLDLGGQDRVGMTVVTPHVETVFEETKKRVLAVKGQILNANVNKDNNGSSTGSMQIRVPSEDFDGIKDYLKSAGRVPYFKRENTINDNESALPGPVLAQITLSDDEPALENVDLVLVTDDVEGKVNLIKSQLKEYEAEITFSSFAQETNGQSEADVVLKAPIKRSEELIKELKSLGDVESSSVHKNEPPRVRPVSDDKDKDEMASVDDSAPAEFHLKLHTHPDIVPVDDGPLSIVKRSFAAGADILGWSLVMIVSLVALILPWFLFVVGGYGLYRAAVWFTKK